MVELNDYWGTLNYTIIFFAGIIKTFVIKLYYSLFLCKHINPRKEHLNFENFCFTEEASKVLRFFLLITRWFLKIKIWNLSRIQNRYVLKYILVTFSLAKYNYFDIFRESIKFVIVIWLMHKTEYTATNENNFIITIKPLTWSDFSKPHLTFQILRRCLFSGKLWNLYG